MSPALQKIIDRWSRKSSLKTRSSLVGIIQECGKTPAGREKLIRSCLEPGRQRLHFIVRDLARGFDGFDVLIKSWRPYVRDAQRLLDEYEEFHELLREAGGTELLSGPAVELALLIEQTKAVLIECQNKPQKNAHRAALLGLLQWQVDRPPPPTVWERLLRQK